MKHSIIMGAIAAMALSTAAHATSTLQVSTVNFKVTATGGQFAWVKSDGVINTLVRDQIGWTGGTPAFGADLTDAAVIPTDNAAMVTSGAGNAASASFSSALSAINLSTSASGGYAQGSRDWTGVFYVAANTTVKFEWDSVAYGSNAGGADGALPNGLVNAMNISSWVSVGTQTRKFEYSATGTPFSAAGFELGDGSPEHLSITFKNTGNTAMYASFKSSIKASTLDVVTAAVPEADGYVLAAAGLATVGLLSARRRRNG